MGQGNSDFSPIATLKCIQEAKACFSYRATTEAKRLLPVITRTFLRKQKWERPDLNRRPIGYQPIALTAELRSLDVKFSRFLPQERKRGGGEGEALSQPLFYYSVFHSGVKGGKTEPFETTSSL